MSLFRCVAPARAIAGACPVCLPTLAVLVLCLTAPGCGGGSDSSFGSLRSTNRPGALGASIVVVSDLDGDGTFEVVVGAPGFSGRASDQGIVDLISLSPDGTFPESLRIGLDESGFSGDLDRFDSFGQALCALGDLDGNGQPEIAVGAPDDDDGISGAGAVWVLSLTAGKTVSTTQKISSTVGGFSGVLGKKDRFGSALALLEDLEGDGFQELAIGAPQDDDGGKSRGAVWLLSLNPDGSGRLTRKISTLEGGFQGPLTNGDRLGSSVAALGDLDSDGVGDLAVGAPSDEDGGFASGAVWILFLSAGGTVKAQVKVGDAPDGLNGVLHGRDEFGAAVVLLGDLDGDGTQELAVGAPGDGGKVDLGAVYIVSLETNGSVRSALKIAPGHGGFDGKLNPLNRFGSSLAVMPDLDADGNPELLVGAPGVRSTGGRSVGVWLLFLDDTGLVKSTVKLRQI